MAFLTGRKFTTKPFVALTLLVLLVLIVAHHLAEQR